MSATITKTEAVSAGEMTAREEVADSREGFVPYGAKWPVVQTDVSPLYSPSERSRQEEPVLAGEAAGFVGIHETWDTVMTIDARIVEVHRDWLKLDCLVDRENLEFQERVFDRSLLEGAVPVRVGAYVLIRIFQRTSKIAHTFTDGERYVHKEAFEDDSWFSDLDDTGLNELL